MATLRDYYTLDFSRWMSANQDHKAKLIGTGHEVTYPVRVHEDLNANAKFVSIFVPEALHPAHLAAHYIDNLQDALKVGQNATVWMSFGGLPPQTSNETLVFTRRLFVYAEQRIPDEQIEEFRAYCLKQDIYLVWHDTRYAVQRSMFEKPLAFICHDSRNKEDVAEPIASQLQRSLCPIWYDEYSLGVGDSLRESIEKGIKEANKCIIILSPEFFANEGWTKAEFDSIYTREIVEKSRIMLPIWHNVSRDEVYEYSPRLANRFALNTEIGIENVVTQLRSKLMAK